MLKKENYNELLIFLFSFFSFAVLNYSFYQNFLHLNYVPQINNYLYADWKIVINAAICNSQGYDVYLENPCDLLNRRFTYGPILLSLPFLDIAKNFYYIYFPLIINFLFIFTISKILKPKKLGTFVLIFLLFCSQPVLLGLERANTDLLIFIILIVSSLLRKTIFSHIIIILISISKFYPIILSSIFVFDKFNKRNFFNFLFCAFLILFILFLQFDDLIKIYNNTGELTADLSVLNFSFHLIPRIFNLINDKFFYFNTNDLYLFVYFFLIVINLIILYKNFVHVKNNKYFENFKIYEFESNLFIIFSLILISNFFIHNNWDYRSIFVLGLLPYIDIMIKKKNIFYFKFLKMLILVKFLLISFFSILRITLLENIPHFNGFIIVSKSLIDNFLLIIISSNILYLFFCSIKKSFKTQSI